MITRNYATVNGLNMYYEVHGNGESLVLIHGGGSTIETTFGSILPLLAKRYKVVAVEMQAHGHTGDRDARETFEQDAEDVASLLKQLNIPNASIFGFSNGGNTAMQIAIRHPGIVNKLVIASAFYQRSGMVDGFFENMQYATLENMPELLKTAFLKINPDPDKLRNMHDKDKERMLAFRDWADEDIQSIQAPTLIINGNHDVVKPEHAVKMSQLIPHAELMIVPGIHGSFIGEVCTIKKDSKIPELTIAAIHEFLDEG